MKIHPVHAVSWYQGVALVVAGIALLSAAGCWSGSSPQSAMRDANRTNLQKLANLYSMFQVQHQFKGPASEEAFREFIGQLDTSVHSTMGIDAASLDKLFVSERDREPFKIRYGVPSGPRGSKEPVVFEATGRRGQRMVGFLNMVQREVDASEYDLLWQSEAKPAPKIDVREPGR